VAATPAKLTGFTTVAQDTRKTDGTGGQAGDASVVADLTNNRVLLEQGVFLARLSLSVLCATAGTLTVQLRKGGVAIAEAAAQSIFGAAAQQSVSLAAILAIAAADLVSVTGLPNTMPSNFAALEVYLTHSAGSVVTAVYSQLIVEKVDG
jgi:hypothetical protein